MLYCGTHIDLPGNLGQRAYFASWEAEAKTSPAAAAVVKRYHARPAEELHDLAGDPHEQHNLAGVRAHAAQLERMRTALDVWMREQGDMQKVFEEPRLLANPNSYGPNAPSRNNLLLGIRSTTLGIYSLGEHIRQARPDAITLTQYFMRHGWRAEAIGKILHTADPAETRNLAAEQPKVVAELRAILARHPEANVRAVAAQPRKPEAPAAESSKKRKKDNR